MKKLFLLVIIVCISSNILFAQSKRDSSICFDWDAVTNSWFLSSKNIYTYNSNGKIIGNLSQTWNGMTWLNYELKSANYDTSGKLTSILLQKWNGMLWIDSGQFTSTYDVNGNLTNSLSQVWNGMTWVNNYQYNYTYDANGNQTYAVNQHWNGTTWVNYTNWISTYDTSGNQTIQVQQNWNVIAWVNIFQYNYTYDANRNFTSQLSYVWNGTTWVNSGQYTAIYDTNGNLISDLAEYWNGAAWENNQQHTYTYDINENLTYSLQQDWNGFWRNTFQYIFSYDSIGNWTGYSGIGWDISGTQVTWGDSCHYYYSCTNSSFSQSITISNGESVTVGSHTYTTSDTSGIYKDTLISASANGCDSIITTNLIVLTGIISIAEQNTKLKIYPNPFSNSATMQINGSLPLTNDLIFEIHDILGRKVEQFPITAPLFKIQRDNLPGGIYFYQIKSKSEKIILGNGKLIITDN